MFRLYKRVEPYTISNEEILVADSAVLSVGDVVKIIGGEIEPADATTDAVYGVLTDVVDSKGISLANLGAATLSTGSYVKSTKTFTAGANNSSVDEVRAVVTPIRRGDWLKATLDADKGTTAGSDATQAMFSVLTTDSRKLDEDTISVNYALPLQFRSVAVDGVDLDDNEVVVTVINIQEV